MTNELQDLVDQLGPRVTPTFVKGVEAGAGVREDDGSGWRHGLGDDLLEACYYSDEFRGEDGCGGSLKDRDVLVLAK